MVHFLLILYTKNKRIAKYNTFGKYLDISSIDLAVVSLKEKKSLVNLKFPKLFGRFYEHE